MCCAMLGHIMLCHTLLGCAICNVANMADCCAAKASSEDAGGAKRDRKTGYAPGEWDITRMAPKLKGQA